MSNFLSTYERILNHAIYNRYKSVHLQKYFSGTTEQHWPLRFWPKVHDVSTNQRRTYEIPWRSGQNARSWHLFYGFSSIQLLCKKLTSLLEFELEHEKYLLSLYQWKKDFSSVLLFRSKLLFLEHKKYLATQQSCESNLQLTHYWNSTTDKTKRNSNRIHYVS